MFSETNPTPTRGGGLSRPPTSHNGLNRCPAAAIRSSGTTAVAEIRIGVREFNCIGVSPPHDHPHVYINMGQQHAILCPYCGTRFRFDPRLGPSEADPPDSLFVDRDPG
jgi:uncharacterized Zn-finger protein